MHNLSFLLAFNPPFIALVVFRVVFEQHENFPVVRELNDQMKMQMAIDAILEPLDMSTARLALAGITVKYQSEGGCAGYSDMIPDRILGKYLSDRAKTADLTQDSRPSLYVSLYRDENKLENSTLSRCDTPDSLKIDLVHNTTLHHQCHEVAPSDSSTVVIDFILDRMISQANQRDRDKIDSDAIVVYFNGRIPMMEGIPIFDYILMYGVTTKELAEPIVISFEIIQKCDPWEFCPFLSVYDRAAPVILTYGELDDGTWNGSNGKYATYKLVTKTFVNTKGAPILDRRYGWCCRLFNDLIEAKITDKHSNQWIRRFARVANKDMSWAQSLAPTTHHQPRVYPETSEYYDASNHLSTR